MVSYLLKKKLLSADDKKTLLETPGYPLLTQLATSSADRMITATLFLDIFSYQKSHLTPVIEALFTTAIAKESRTKCANIYKVCRTLYRKIMQLYITVELG